MRSEFTDDASDWLVAVSLLFCDARDLFLLSKDLFLLARVEFVTFNFLFVELSVLLVEVRDLFVEVNDLLVLIRDIFFLERVLYFSPRFLFDSPSELKAIFAFSSLLIESEIPDAPLSPVVGIASYRSSIPSVKVLSCEVSSLFSALNVAYCGCRLLLLLEPADCPAVKPSL